MMVKILQGTQRPSEANAAAGIEWATDHGATVINMSFAMRKTPAQLYCDPEARPKPFPVLQTAIEYAYGSDVVLVAAMGPGGPNPAQDFTDVEYCHWPYPAGYSEVIAVASVDSNDHKASKSHWANWVDVAAPGGQQGVDPGIYSTWDRDGDPPAEYRYDAGTSMAAPYVSGLAALVRSMDPSLDSEEVRSLIKDYADNIDALNPIYAGKLGSGRINAYRILAAVFPPSTPANFQFNTDSNNHPELTWNLNLQFDVSKYFIYRKLSPPDPDFVKIAEVDSLTNTYIDYSVTIGGSGFPKACYRISAVDIVDLESNLTTLKCRPYLQQKPSADNDAPPSSGPVASFRFHGAFPNPFNPEVTIRFELFEQTSVMLRIYDLSGRLVYSYGSEFEGVGLHSINWNAVDLSGTPVASGVYSFVFSAGELAHTGKIAFIR